MEKNTDSGFVVVGKEGQIHDTKSILKKIESLGLRPATIPEILAWGREVGTVRLCIALGNSWVNQDGVDEYLAVGWGLGRGLDWKFRTCVGTGGFSCYDDGVTFLAVRP